MIILLQHARVFLEIGERV